MRSSNDTEIDDYGEPAESTPDTEPDTGSSGAEEGISPISDEPYEQD